MIVAYVGIAAAMVGLYREIDRSSKADRALIVANQDAVYQGCLEREEVRTAVRTLMEEVIRFNTASSNPELTARVATYQRIVEASLMPKPCRR